jgi:diguanylate cyclase (GGDEF)-like protein
MNQNDLDRPVADSTAHREPSLPADAGSPPGTPVPGSLPTADNLALADTDQANADRDQTGADTDQTAAEDDQASADRDQRASDRDQDTTDREEAAGPESPAQQDAHQEAREERAASSVVRIRNRLWRTGSTRDREATATDRDRTAAARDENASVAMDEAVDLARSITDPDNELLRQLDELSAVAAAARARAAADRERAAQDRASAARERARLEAELRLAHLDQLTGTYHREMGQMALSQEIDRARRADGRFVVAFVDVDGLKAVNDLEGHAAGDRVLQLVARAIRTNLRSFDPIIRYGGDEFVCGLGGANLSDAMIRFRSIEKTLKSDANVGISVGFSVLGAGDTVGAMTERADAAMLQVKAQHHLVA